MKLKIWWIPQIPMKAFEILDVPDIATAKILLSTLGDYDLFQYEYGIKGDYSNAGGLLMWDDSLDTDNKGEKWTEWESPDFDSIDDLTLEQCRAIDALMAVQS